MGHPAHKNKDCPIIGCSSCREMDGTRKLKLTKEEKNKLRDFIKRIRGMISNG